MEANDVTANDENEHRTHTAKASMFIRYRAG
jgi:hypothetical protein